jgi:probable phosphoglycerate mutase
MTELYLTRHGETEWNVQKRAQGFQDSPLTPRGLEQARLLSERLGSVRFDAIFTSPLPRAYRTAQIIAGRHGRLLHSDDRIREIYLGEWEGMTFREISALYPQENQYFWSAPDLYIPISGESFDDLRRRIESFIRDILKSYPSGRVLVVSHAVAVMTMIAFFNGTPLSGFWDAKFIDSTSLTIIESNGNGGRLVLHGDTSHLSREES